MEKGQFIVCEGADGTGKTTLCKRLMNELNNTVYVRFPSDTPIGELIRNQLIKDKDFNKDALSLMFQADRVNFTETIIKYLSEGKKVICDRFVLSGYIYAEATECQFDPMMDSRLVPDVIIYMQKKKTIQNDADIFGTDTIQNKVAEMFNDPNILYIVNVKPLGLKHLALQVRETRHV
jgi:dTMP kinase